MFRFFTISFLVILTNTILIGQTVEVIYKCQNKNKIEDILNKNKHKYSDERKEMLLSMKDLFDNYYINFSLNQEKNISCFFPKGAETNILTKNISTGKASYYLEQKDDEFHKDFTNKMLLANKHKHSRIFYIKDTIPNFCWNFTSEKKEILGYICSKAVINDYHGEEIVAWFASEIPIPNGPIEFGGLPGLILELTNKVLKYEATEIYLNPKETTKIEKPNQKEKQIITMTEFFEKTKKVKSFGKKGS